MNEIIKVNETKVNNDLIQTVNARELYECLGLKKSQVSRWIRNNITDNPFAVENVDYLGFDINVEGNTVKEYALSIDFAKKICMLSRTETGEKIRDYFLKVEKMLNRYKIIRLESKEARRKFTDTLKNHGYTKHGEYIQTTIQMKKELNIEKKKEEMNELELKKIMASELIAEINIEQTNSLGYREVNPICVNSCKAINAATTALIN